MICLYEIMIWWETFPLQSPTVANYWPGVNIIFNDVFKYLQKGARGIGAVSIGMLISNDV